MLRTFGGGLLGDIPSFDTWYLKIFSYRSSVHIFPFYDHAVLLSFFKICANLCFNSYLENTFPHVSSSYITFFYLPRQFSLWLLEKMCLAIFPLNSRRVHLSDLIRIFFGVDFLEFLVFIDLVAISFWKYFILVNSWITVSIFCKGTSSKIFGNLLLSHNLHSFLNPHQVFLW